MTLACLLHPICRLVATMARPWSPLPRRPKLTFIGIRMTTCDVSFGAPHGVTARQQPTELDPLVVFKAHWPQLWLRWWFSRFCSGDSEAVCVEHYGAVMGCMRISSLGTSSCVCLRLGIAASTAHCHFMMLYVQNLTRALACMCLLCQGSSKMCELRLLRTASD